MRVVTLRPGRESSVGRRHPWLFSGAIADSAGDRSDGRVEVRDAAGARLASGFDGGSASLAARLWAFGAQVLDEELIRNRFERALDLRHQVVSDDTTGFRLLHSEGDETPGLIADRYGDCDVVVFTAAGLVAQEAEILRLYREVFSPKRLVVRHEGERSAADEPATSEFREY